jgi:2,5-diamino-6-(ribosylamino)-4(3H)-pyrimidinone 5'-phosphate reductase
MVVMLPRVVIFNAVSADGRTVGLATNLGLFYGLASQFHEDVTLAGSETILVASVEAGDEGGEDQTSETGPEGGILCVIDSRGRIKNWRAIRRWPYWGRYVSVCSRSTPPEHLDYLKAEGVETIVTGENKVDLRALLETLAGQYDAKSVRVESGGTLNGVLLDQGLVSEVSVLIHPTLVGSAHPTSIYQSSDSTKAQAAIPLKVTDLQRLEDDYIWIRYEVQK